MIHAHVTTWFIALILFFVSFSLLRKGNMRGQKITHMILRLFYLLVLATGGHLLSLYQFSSLALLKTLIGVLVIASMELVLSRGKKGKPVKNFLILFALSLVLVLYFGYVVLG
ncbi:YisL family protein [Cytobacillus spongiae]|uniref:YisL family protein n=1 Tax=Cytobacillus spongiae TaxID=2901381 RepID=UPI001F3B05BC|nr:YisL family protein [Cytobacillus spongiae]UII56327.1 YisL family protein [Cytobacillus spongiae]